MSTVTFPAYGSCVCYVATVERSQVINEVPCDWWQAVRARWAPKWWLERHPIHVRYFADHSERITLRKLDVPPKHQDPPKPRIDVLDCTNYDGGACGMKVYSCSGAFLCDESESDVRHGTRLHVEHPEALVCWDAVVSFTGSSSFPGKFMVAWKSDGAPRPMKKREGALFAGAGI